MGVSCILVLYQFWTHFIMSFFWIFFLLEIWIFSSFHYDILLCKFFISLK